MLTRDGYRDASSPDLYSKNNTLQFRSAAIFLTDNAQWIEKDLPVLDIGCGTGELTAWIHSKFSVPVTGTDISKARIQFADEHQRKTDLSFHVNDIITQVPSSQMNTLWKTVISCNALHHIPKKYQLRAFRNIYNSLTPDGMALFLIPNHTDIFHQAITEVENSPEWRETFHGFDINDVRTYEGSDWYLQRLRNAGFREVQVSMEEEKTEYLSPEKMKDFIYGWLPNLAWMQEKGKDSATQERFVDDLISKFFKILGDQPQTICQNKIIASVSAFPDIKREMTAPCGLHLKKSEKINPDYLSDLMLLRQYYKLPGSVAACPCFFTFTAKRNHRAAVKQVVDLHKMHIAEDTPRTTEDLLTDLRRELLVAGNPVNPKGRLAGQIHLIQKKNGLNIIDVKDLNIWIERNFRRSRRLMNEAI